MNFSHCMMAAFASAVLLAGCQTTQNPETMNLATAEPAQEATQEEYATQSVAVSDPDYDPDEIICREDYVTGSRISKRKDCRTAKQWRDSTTNAQRAIDDLRNRQCPTNFCNAEDPRVSR